MGNQLNSINSIESPKQLSKSKRFVENTKRAVRKVLTSTGIAASTMGPMATTTTATFVPASVNTISVVAPTASTVAKAISLGTAASLLTACGGEDGPDDPINVRDTTPPTINISKSEVDITGGKEIRINGSQLYIGSELVASRSDNKTRNCIVSLSINGKNITSGTTISEEGTLTIKVSDEAGNIKSSDIKLNKAIEHDISGLENLKNLNMQVDQEINLLDGVTFGNGANLERVEIEIDGQRIEVSDPRHYIPDYPGTCNIIIVVKDKNGKVTEHKVENLTIKPLEYKAMEITNIKPVDILPTIGQVEGGDKQVYEHIEHLRIAEATRIRDMMREYGAGNHSAEEYKQLMNRLNTGMIGEEPKGYNNYEYIGTSGNTPSDHAHDERDILNTLIKHANFKVVNQVEGTDEDALYNFAKNNNKSINIFGNSMSREGTNKEGYLNIVGTDTKRKLLKLKNFILFCAGTNIRNNGTLKNKIYQENITIDDEHGIYGMPSTANGKSDATIDKHLLVTIGTNRNGDINQTNEIGGFSKFPVGFHNKVLFSGRAFPYKSIVFNEIEGEAGKYATSYTNYLNVATADILFQIKADVTNVDELLEMITSTALIDHIKFDLNGDGDTNDTYQGQPENQPLLLMNPAGFFKKYLMPTDIPSSIQSSKTITLNKGYYKGLIFDIPGAEVKINGQWVTYNDANKSQIKSQNPMTLEWRINGDLCKKMGYQGKSVNGKIIVVDDKRDGLNIDKEFSILLQ